MGSSCDGDCWSHHDANIYDHDQPVSQLVSFEAAIDLGGGNMRRPMLEAADTLKFWQLLTVGYDLGRDLNFAKEPGLATSNCPGSTCSAGLAEVAFMFMLTKKYRASQDSLKQGKLHTPMMGDVEGKSVGIIGCGASGQALAQRARAFGMSIMIIDPLPIDQSLLNEVQPVFVDTPDAIDHVISEADFISLHLLVTPQTERALHIALREGKIGGLGTDVYYDYNVKPSQDILGHPRFVALPHVLGTSLNSTRGRATMALENLNRIAEGLEPEYRII